MGQISPSSGSCSFLAVTELASNRPAARVQTLHPNSLSCRNYTYGWAYSSVNRSEQPFTNLKFANSNPKSRGYRIPCARFAAPLGFCGPIRDVFFLL